MLLSADGSVLLLIDLQERLMPAMYDGDLVVARAVATPASSPFSFDPAATDRTTNIKIAVSTTSSTKLCRADPAGCVPPNVDT